jgi:hypothetical protein
MNNNSRYSRPTSCVKQISLLNTFRKLWEQHVMWTRSFIISTAASLGDLQLVTKRLLRNPSDFANELQKFYGPDKSKKFETLLTEHLLIAAKLVNAVKAKDPKSAEDARKKWYQNADEIALFLSSINPYWSKQEWENMLYEHLKMTENEAKYRLSSQYASDIAEYEEIENQALKMADYMVEGIRKQFRL